MIIKHITIKCFMCSQEKGKMFYGVQNLANIHDSSIIMVASDFATTFYHTQ